MSHKQSLLTSVQAAEEMINSLSHVYKIPVGTLGTGHRESSVVLTWMFSCHACLGPGTARAQQVLCINLGKQQSGFRD